MGFLLSEQHQILSDKRVETLAKALTVYKDLLRCKKLQFTHTARHNGVPPQPPPPHPCNINQ